ncbi:sensor histidine kinase [Ilumatobacter sp.]|uniref:sensor histidine kinase n=1 Tax=Ilumatobacter sp. TaxID=1967498 RepID=UPI003B51A281
MSRFVGGGGPTQLARIGFAFVVCAAVVGDLSLAGLTVEVPSAWTLAGLVGLSISGLVAVLRSDRAVVAGAGASVASVVVTLSYVGVDGRLTFLTDAVVLPAVVFVLLSAGGAPARVVAVCAALAGLSIGARQARPANQIILTMVVFIGLAGAAVAVAYLRSLDRERRARVALERQAERLALAREIHDVVGHHVTGMIVLAQGRRFSGRPDPSTAGGPVDSTLVEIEAAGHETMRSVRHLVQALRNEDADTVATWDDLERLVADARSSHPGMDLRLVDEVLDPAASEAVWVAMRVLREAVTNARRHGVADGSDRGSLRRTEDGIHVTLENGIAPGDRGEGFGLPGMRERIQSIGGTFSAGPSEPGRWRVAATIPADPAVRR